VSERRESDAADDAYEHLVDLYCDVIGEEPPAKATPAELAAAIRAVARRLGLTRTRN
jgi:hypothetical protein